MMQLELIDLPEHGVTLHRVRRARQAQVRTHRVLALALALVAMLAFTGCGDNATTPTPESTVTPAGESTPTPTTQTTTPTAPGMNGPQPSVAEVLDLLHVNNGSMSKVRADGTISGDMVGTSVSYRAGMVMADGRLEMAIAGEVPEQGQFTMHMISEPPFVFFQNTGAGATDPDQWYRVHEGDFEQGFTLSELLETMEDPRLLLGIYGVIEDLSVDDVTAAAAEAMTIDFVGEEEVEGIPTRHFEVSIDYAAYFEALTNELDLQPDQKEALTGNGTQTLDLWIDDQQRPVRYSIELTNDTFNLPMESMAINMTYFYEDGLSITLPEEYQEGFPPEFD